MAYTAQPPKLKPDGVTMNDVKDFYIDYIKNDRLGMICGAWLVRADGNGPKHHYCLELAARASVAVGFNKSGVPTDLPRELQPQQLPDFTIKPRSKSKRPTYESQKVLGKLLRSVLIGNLTNAILERFLHAGYEQWLEFAAGVARDYTNDLDRLIRLWRVRNEGEFLTGAISMLDGIHRRKAHDIQINIQEDMGRLVREYRDYVLWENDTEVVEEDALRIASAWEVGNRTSSSQR